MVSTKQQLEQEIKNSAQNFLKNFSVEYFDEDIGLISGIELKKLSSGVKTHRNMFYFCHQGELTIETPDGHYVLSQGETFVCPTGTYVTLSHFTPESKFSALGLTDRIIQTLLNTNMNIWNNLVYVMKERVVRPIMQADGEKEYTLWWHFTEMMHILLEEKDRPFGKEMIYLMLQMGLLSFCAPYKDSLPAEQQVQPTAEKGLSQCQIIFSKFMEILQNEPMKHRPVYYYADQLCISAKYLSYVCKTISGKSASDFIKNAVVGEIMYYLEKTTLSVKEISNIMGFPNISFFGKFVKSNLGASPNKYRK